jgi:hypothetical protein
MDERRVTILCEKYSARSCRIKLDAPAREISNVDLDIEFVHAV